MKLIVAAAKKQGTRVTVAFVQEELERIRDEDCCSRQQLSAMASSDDNRKWFEELGPEKVREYIATGMFAGQRVDYARAWVEEQERAQDQASQRRHETIAERSAGAAERQAHYAKVAIGISIAAILLAAGSLVVSVFAPFR